MKTLDKYKGCLIGGAAGDALGYAIEFNSLEDIKQVYGKNGITEYELVDGKARISDDTQMTMFTANGLLIGATRRMLGESKSSFSSYIAHCYRQWYCTQTMEYPLTFADIDSWLVNLPEMFSRRAPGGTCLSAIVSGCDGTIEKPMNSSKGCGGVMRVAPIGLYFDPESCDKSQEEIDRIGAEAAVLTHGHPLGYIPAAALVHIVNLAAHTDMKLKDIVFDMQKTIGNMFKDNEYLSDFSELIDKAILFAERNMSDEEAIKKLGEGWVAEETLAIAVYCALRYENDFDKALITSVNHSGDSDSTGAVTGNILGAYLGYHVIPDKYKEHLELKDEIMELAEDLFKDCKTVKENDSVDCIWKQKYVEGTYREDKQ